MNSYNSYEDVARFDRALVLEIANEVIDMISDVCERVEIAGSIRRKTRWVKDIELVCIPKMRVQQNGLFNEFGGEPVSMLAERLDSLVAEDDLVKWPDRGGRVSWGPRSRRAAIESRGITIPIDFSMVRPPAQWGVIFAIRTGNYEFGRHVMTLHSQGGRMPENRRISKGALWEVDPRDRDKTIRLIPTPEEADFFSEIGFADYPAPEHRRYEEPTV